MKKLFDKAKILISIVILFVTLFSIFQLLLAKELKVYDAKLEELPYELSFRTIRKIEWFDDIFYVLEMENHRIVLIKDWKIIDQIGKIGNGKGELYYPEDFAISRKGFLFVLDSGNNRIQVFDSNKKYVNDFTIPFKPWGIEVNSDNEVFLGQPASNNLICVYSLKGKKLRSFGSLKKASEIYGIDYKKYDDSHKIPLNRVWLTLDDKNNLWVGFLHAPLIHKYNLKGELILEKIINVPDLEPLKKAVWQSPPPTEYLSMNIDGIQLTLIIKDITFDWENKLILVLLGDNRIIALDSEGKEKYIIKPMIKRGALERLAIAKNGEIFLTAFFSPKIYKLIF